MLQRYLTDPAKKPYLHTDLADATGYLSMNLTLPPFDDIHIRKAVNWVLDRQALLQAEVGQRRSSRRPTPSRRRC